jgi:HEAT repeat protein
MTRHLLTIQMRNPNTIQSHVQRQELPVDSVRVTAYRTAAFAESESSSEDAPPPEEIDTPLDEAASDEREYVRHRLREELKREPTEDEVDEWLRQHTEGY